MANVTEREIWTAVKLLTQRSQIITGTVTGNFFGGACTSGLPGQDLFTYGLPNQWWRLTEGYFRLMPAIWTWGARITVRTYFNIMGGMQLIGEADYDADGTDGNIAYIYWFWLAAEMYGPLRVELQSNNAGDINVTVPYEYRVKDW